MRCEAVGAPSDALLSGFSADSRAGGAGAGEAEAAGKAAVKAAELRLLRRPLTSQSLVSPQSRKERSFTTLYSFYACV